VFKVTGYGRRFLGERLGSERYCALSYKDVQCWGPVFNSAEASMMHNYFDTLRKAVTRRFPSRGMYTQRTELQAAAKDTYFHPALYLSPAQHAAAEEAERIASSSFPPVKAASSSGDRDALAMLTPLRRLVRVSIHNLDKIRFNMVHAPVTIMQQRRLAKERILRNEFAQLRDDLEKQQQLEKEMAMLGNKFQEVAVAEEASLASATKSIASETGSMNRIKSKLARTIESYLARVALLPREEEEEEEEEEVELVVNIFSQLGAAKGMTDDMSLEQDEDMELANNAIQKGDSDDLDLINPDDKSVGSSSNDQRSVGSEKGVSKGGGLTRDKRSDSIARLTPIHIERLVVMGRARSSKVEVYVRLLTAARRAEEKAKATAKVSAVSSGGGTEIGLGLGEKVVQLSQSTTEVSPLDLSQISGAGADKEVSDQKGRPGRPDRKAPIKFEVLPEKDTFQRVIAPKFRPVRPLLWRSGAAAGQLLKQQEALHEHGVENDELAELSLKLSHPKHASGHRDELQHSQLYPEHLSFKYDLDVPGGLRDMMLDMESEYVKQRRAHLSRYSWNTRFMKLTGDTQFEKAAKDRRDAEALVMTGGRPRSARHAVSTGPGTGVGTGTGGEGDEVEVEVGAVSGATSPHLPSSNGLSSGAGNTSSRSNSRGVSEDQQVRVRASASASISASARGTPRDGEGGDTKVGGAAGNKVGLGDDDDDDDKSQSTKGHDQDDLESVTSLADTSVSSAPGLGVGGPESRRPSDVPMSVPVSAAASPSGHGRGKGFKFHSSTKGKGKEREQNVSKKQTVMEKFFATIDVESSSSAFLDGKKKNSKTTRFRLFKEEHGDLIPQDIQGNGHEGPSSALSPRSKARDLSRVEMLKQIHGDDTLARWQVFSIKTCVTNQDASKVTLPTLSNKFDKVISEGDEVKKNKGRYGSRMVYLPGKYEDVFKGAPTFLEVATKARSRLG